MTDTSYDAIVVGTGPGGASVAKSLSEKGKRILILEWGSDAPLKGSVKQMMTGMAVPGKSLLLTSDLCTVVRGVIAGGSSVFYYETAFEPPFDLLEKYGIDIKSEVKQAREELPIAPLSDDLLGPMAKRLMASAQELGHDWQKLPKYIYQDKCRPNCWKCQYGCPYDAKWSARMYLDETLNNGSTMISGARVKRVLFEGSSATGVEYSKWGRSYTARAPKIIISAGGIGSPLILRASGIRDAGYDFFFDPLITVMGEVDDIDGGKEIPMAAGLNMAEEGYMITDMTVPKELFYVLAGQVFRVDRLPAHKKMLTIMIKAKDDLGGRLTDWGGVRKPLSDSDRKKLLRGYERARRILKNAGAKNIFKSWYMASHPGGTVKINEIVDSNLKTKYDNLYVCDCSVIPESWGLPPTLTLIGLGKRLAGHIAGE